MNKELTTREIENSLYAELIALVYKQNARAFIPLAITIGLIAFLLNRTIDSSLALLWFAVAFTFLSIRLIVLHWINKSDRWNHETKLSWICILSVINGSMHASSLIFFSALPEVDRAILSMILMALGAGSVGTSAGYQPVFWCYTTPVLLSSSVSWLFNVYSTIPQLYAIWIGISMLFLFATLASLSHHTFRYFTSSVIAISREKSLTQQLTTALEQAQLEKSKAEASNRSKVRFLAAASHDLRQPVHVLTLFSAALQQQNLSDEAMKISGDMEKAISSLASQLHSLLDVSKLDAGIVEPKLANLSYSGLVETLVRESLYDAEMAGLTIASEVEPDIKILTDSIMLTQIVRNLLTNAIKYTHRGSITVKLHKRDGQIVLQIIDTGVGIAENDRNNVFEEFYQVGNTHRDASEGLGLGLSIVQRLCNLLGASIELDSSIGQGTSVTVVHPVGEHEYNAITVEPSSKTPIRNYGFKIHVIDDQILIRQGTCTLLDSLGCETSSAASTAESLAMVRSDNPDVFFVDLRLEGGDSGLYAIESLQPIFPEAHFIMISGDTNLERLGLDQRGVATLQKPLKIDDLVELLDGIKARQVRKIKVS